MASTAEADHAASKQAAWLGRSACPQLPAKHAHESGDENAEQAGEEKAKRRSAEPDANLQRIR
jgi:hypothetical protein